MNTENSALNRARGFFENVCMGFILLFESFTMFLKVKYRGASVGDVSKLS